MADVVEQFPRLQYEMMEYALRLPGGAGGGDDANAACQQAWDRLQGGREGAEPISFDDFRRLFEATLRRCPELRGRPAA